MIYRSNSATDQQAAAFGDKIKNSGAGDVEPLLGENAPLAWHATDFNASIIEELKKDNVFGSLVYDTESQEDFTDDKPDTAFASRSISVSSADKKSLDRFQKRGQCCGRPAKPDKQSQAPNHLVLISTKPGDPPGGDEYLYDQNAGDSADVTIYIMEQDIQADHPMVKQYEDLTGKTVKILSGSYQGKPGNVDPEGHGTCVWAYAVSGLLGVAKKASVVVSTFDTVPGQPNRARTNSWNKAFSLVVRDIQQKKAGHRAIINISNSRK